MWSEVYSDAEDIKEMIEDSVSDKINEVNIDFMRVEIVDDRLEALEVDIPVSTLKSDVIDEVELGIDELMHFGCNYTEISERGEWTVWKFVFEKPE